MIMLRKILKYAIEGIKKPARSIRDFIRNIPYYGNARWCPVCEKSSRKFSLYGVPTRDDAKCVFCGALERHRFVWLYFVKMTNLFEAKKLRMLHVAPEKCFESKIRDRLGQNYITADLLNPRAMVRMDITNIQYPDEYFDVIYCSHVLEHVPNDKMAMREFYRVLKSDGWAILIVPITAEKTFEDPSVVDPSERLKLFGQYDHVRRYGPDYVDRLHEAGFKVKVTHASDLFGSKDIVRLGLTRVSGGIYFCTKM